jgi:hypothetical protein
MSDEDLLRRARHLGYEIECSDGIFAFRVGEAVNFCGAAMLEHILFEVETPRTASAGNDPERPS